MKFGKRTLVIVAGILVAILLVLITYQDHKEKMDERSDTQSLHDELSPGNLILFLK